MVANTQDIGARIKAARKNLGYTLEDAAKATGMSLVTISRLENGHNRPSAKSAEKLQKGLGVVIEQQDTYSSALSAGLERRVSDLELQMDTIVEDVLNRLDALEADPMDPAAARALLVKISQFHPEEIKAFAASLPEAPTEAPRVTAKKPARRQPQPA